MPIQMHIVQHPASGRAECGREGACRQAAPRQAAQLLADILPYVLAKYRLTQEPPTACRLPPGDRHSAGNKGPVRFAGNFRM